jgi:ribosome-associated protein
MDEEDLTPSKSAVKRAMTALQDLGQELVNLSASELAKMPIEDEQLAQAITQARSINSNSARKRQLQYIGKLMRKIDAEALRQALALLHLKHNQSVDSFHQLEVLRDELLQDSPDAIAAVVALYADADRQYLRQMVRQHQQQASSNKPPVAARKLFKYLRQLAENQKQI